MPARSRSPSRDGDQAFQPESLCRSDGSSQVVAQPVTDGLPVIRPELRKSRNSLLIVLNEVAVGTLPSSFRVQYSFRCPHVDSNSDPDPGTSVWTL
jgi:hypothetical protein